MGLLLPYGRCCRSYGQAYLIQDGPHLCGPIYMTNKTAIVFGICLLVAILHDVTMNGSENVVFLGQQGLRLIDYLAFWR
jgi:hypothetical protein